MIRKTGRRHTGEPVRRRPFRYSSFVGGVINPNFPGSFEKSQIKLRVTARLLRKHQTRFPAHFYKQLRILRISFHNAVGGVYDISGGIYFEAYVKRRGICARNYGVPDMESAALLQNPVYFPNRFLLFFPGHIHQRIKGGCVVERTLVKRKSRRIHQYFRANIRSFVKFLPEIINGCHLLPIDSADNALAAATDIQNLTREGLVDPDFMFFRHCGKFLLEFRFVQFNSKRIYTRLISISANRVISSANSRGCSKAVKWPPLGMLVY